MPDSVAESTTSTSTTTTVAELEVYDPLCVVEVEPGDSLGAIVSDRADELVTVASVQAENGLDGELIVPDQLLDVCIDNGLNDVTGEQRLERNAAIVAAENFATVGTQQAALNALLTPFGYPEMPVDGVSGPVTRRALCASRLAMGLPVDRSDMEADSPAEGFLLALTELPIPPNTATDGRWILIDLTCQVMFVGEGQNLVFVFPTSTGEFEHETRLQERSRAFRYDPALDNGGWHNSTSYPVTADNPLNGNMYKPLYFDNGQAIHGANSVPTSPQSKGCARLRPANQDALVAWLGLGDVSGPVGTSRIDATVTVRGDYDLG
ncbi:MAG: L,D-transpeptidase family protein [Ilumatobacteraceae bacterium]